MTGTSSHAGKSYRVNPNTDSIAFFPALAVMGYPFLLMLFHVLVGPPGSHVSWLQALGAAIVLICVFAVPIVGLAVACRPIAHASVRRLAYATIVSPTLYVFLGVIQALISSPIPDPWVWCIMWLGVTFWALRSAGHETLSKPSPRIVRWRVAHGVSALILCLYVLFHLANHLVGLIGPDEYGAFSDIGRAVYRAAFIEPVLVMALLFQIASGLYLAWRWSEAKHDFFRTFQIASGAYLSMFILGHMNSVFIYARTFLGIPTDWNFATGGPIGIIHDPWNIRLLPHYALGVFFVLSHLVAGLRVVLNAHGVERRTVNRLWFAGVATSGAIAAAIMAGMCGVRV